MMLEFVSLAGAKQLDANAYLLRCAGQTVLIDAGAANLSRASWLDELDIEPDWTILTHAHADHIGALPTLLERFPGARVLATPSTRALAAISLEATLRARGASRDLARARGQAIADSIRQLPFLSRKRLLQGEVSSIDLTLYPCGHIPGAASVCLDMTLDAKFHTICVLLDFSAHAQPITPRASFPTCPIHTLVMEGALATERAVDRVHYEQEMARLVTWVVEREGACLLALASMGEAPEVAAALLGAEQPVIAHEFLAPIFSAFWGAELPELEQIEFMSDRGCARALAAGRVVIAPGEHLDSGTPAYRLCEPLIGDTSARIGILNSLRHKSFAGRLLKAKQGAVIKKDSRVKEVSISRFLLPNHAPRWALVGAVKAMAPSRVMLVHGKAKSLKALAAALVESGYDGEILIPEVGEVVALE